MKLKTVILTLFILCLTVGIVSAHGHHDKLCKDCNKYKFDHNKNHKDKIKDNTPVPDFEESDDPIIPDNEIDVPDDSFISDNQLEEPADLTVSGNTDNGHIATDEPYVNLIDNPNAKDPTFAEVVEFIKADQTEKKTYVKGEYMCDSFSRDVHNNAEAAGLKCAWVDMFLSDGEEMCIVAFRTTDKGLIYVDCIGKPEGSGQDMLIRNVKEGIAYHAEFLYPPYEYEYDLATIERFTLYW